MFSNYQENKMNPVWMAVVALSVFIVTMMKWTARSKPATDYLEMSQERMYLLNRADREARDKLNEEHC